MSIAYISTYILKYDQLFINAITGQSTKKPMAKAVIFDDGAANTV